VPGVVRDQARRRVLPFTVELVSGIGGERAADLGCIDVVDGEIARRGRRIRPEPRTR
jgi:hypothetical protein